MIWTAAMPVRGRQPFGMPGCYDRFVNNNQPPSDGLRLKTLLKDAGIKSSRLDSTRRLALFRGRTRDWSFSTTLTNGWFYARAYVCEIPEAAGLRAELLDAAMVTNQSMSLTKFVKADALFIELDYREEHLQPGVMGNLLGLLVSNADEYYPRLFRIVTGDAVLEALESTGLSNAA